MVTTVRVDVCLARRVASLRRLWIFILVLCVTREWTSHRGLKGNYVGAAGGEWLGEWGCRGGRSRSRRWRIGGDTSDNLAKIRRPSFALPRLRRPLPSDQANFSGCSSFGALRLFHGETANLLGKFLLGKSRTLLCYLLPLRRCRSTFERDIFIFISLPFLR